MEKAKMATTPFPEHTSSHSRNGTFELELSKQNGIRVHVFYSLSMTDPDSIRILGLCYPPGVWSEGHETSDCQNYTLWRGSFYWTLFDLARLSGISLDQVNVMTSFKNGIT